MVEYIKATRTNMFSIYPVSRPLDLYLDLDFCDEHLQTQVTERRGTAMYLHSSDFLFTKSKYAKLSWVGGRLVKAWLTNKTRVGKISNWQPGPPVQGEEGGGLAKVTNVAKPSTVLQCECLCPTICPCLTISSYKQNSPLLWVLFYD